MMVGRRLAAGVLWMFAGGWLEQAVNLLVFVVMARLLGAELVGLSTMAFVTIVLAEFLVRETIAESIIKIDDLEPGHKDAVFWLLAIISIVLCLALLAASGVIARFYSEPSAQQYIIAATPAVLFVGFSAVPVATLRRNLEFRIIAIRAFVAVVVGGVVGIALALSGFGVWSLIAQRLTQIFVNSAFAWIAAPWMPGFRATRRHLSDVFSFGVKMIGIRTFEQISFNTPAFIIGAYLGATQLGYYSIAWRLVETLSFVLTTPIRMVVQPAFAYVHRIKENATTLLANALYAAGLLVFVGFMGTIVISESIIGIAFGEQWLPASPVLQSLCVFGMYLSLERIQLSFCIALGRAGWPMLFSAIEAGLVLLIMIIWVNHGLQFVVTAYIMLFLLLWPLRIHFLLQVSSLSISSYLAALLPTLLLSAVATGIAYLVGSEIVDSRLSTETLIYKAGVAIIVAASIYFLGIALFMRKRLQSLRQMLSESGGDIQ